MLSGKQEELGKWNFEPLSPGNTCAVRVLPTPPVLYTVVLLTPRLALESGGGVGAGRGLGQEVFAYVDGSVASLSSDSFSNFVFHTSPS